MFKPHWKKSTRAIATAGIAFLSVGCIGFVLMLIEKVTGGHGGERLFTLWGVDMSYLATLATVVLVPILAAAAWGWDYLARAEERDLLRRYGKDRRER